MTRADQQSCHLIPILTITMQQLSTFASKGAGTYSTSSTITINSHKAARLPSRCQSKMPQTWPSRLPDSWISHYPFVHDHPQLQMQRPQIVDCKRHSSREYATSLMRLQAIQPPAWPQDDCFTSICSMRLAMHARFARSPFPTLHHPFRPCSLPAAFAISYSL